MIRNQGSSICWAMRLYNVTYAPKEQDTPSLVVDAATLPIPGIPCVRLVPASHIALRKGTGEPYPSSGSSTTRM